MVAVRVPAGTEKARGHADGLHISRLREIAAERDRELAAIAANAEEPSELVEADQRTA
jgi:hypothetical protein